MSETEFKNENLSVKVEKTPGSQVKFEFSVTPQATNAAYEKAIKNVSKEVVLPGFRKGKAPKALILEKFKNAVKEEWELTLINVSFHEALQLTNMVPFSRDSIKPKIHSVSNENGSSFSITFEARPEVPKINPSEITLKNVPVKQVTEKDIEDRIHELRLHQATWDEIKERSIQDGDFVHLDIESLDEPGVIICKDQPFSVVKGKIGKWLYNLLLGKNLNETFEGVSEKDDCCDSDDPNHVHHHHHDHEFKPTRLKVTVQAIKHPNLPEVTTEFASKLGADSVETLRERVVLSLEKNFKEEAQEHLRDQVEEIVLEKYPFDLPASILKSHGHSMDENQLKELSDSYRLYLITEKLAHELNLDITQDEIMQEFMIQAYMTNPEDSIINPKADPKEIHHQIRALLLERKAKDYLIEHAHKE